MSNCTPDAPAGPDGVCRCFWANESDPMRAYHDDEWGVPVRDSQQLFAKLLLDGFQAGLSWRTILHKRENFLRAFDNFTPHLVATYDETKIQSLLADPGIVRNRQKVRGSVRNAQAYLALTEQVGSFSDWLWSFVGDETCRPQGILTLQTIPATSPESVAMSKALVKAGFTFVGPTICYAFMQAVGMVDDHVIGCFRYRGPLDG